MAVAGIITAATAPSSGDAPADGADSATALLRSLRFGVAPLGSEGAIGAVQLSW